MQKAERLAEKATALAQASESLGSHPTWLLWPSLGVGAALFGAALFFQGTIGTILVIAGAVALVYSRSLSFVSSTQIHISRQLERSRRSP